MLKIDNLTVSVNDKIILNDFALNIEKNTVHAVMGPNGIGKSTICKTLMGDPNYIVEKGKLIFDDVDLLKLKVNERANLGIYLVSQNPIEVPGVTNAEMLRMALTIKTGENVSIFEFNKKMEQFCDMLNIPRSFIHRNINDGMSGGERKKCELLHMWMLEPKMIILDELDSGLDVDSISVVCDSINEYRKSHECSILLITHHKWLIEKLNTDFVHILKDGHIVKTGSKELADIVENEGYSIFNSTNKVSGIKEDE